MIWRRVLVSSSITLRELHGILQVAVGWDGIRRLLKAEVGVQSQKREFESTRSIRGRLRMGAG